MRKQLLGLLVPLTAFVLIANAADMTGNGLAASAALQKLEVAHSQDGLRVEFKAKGTLAPKVTTLDSPARIVVDFPNTVMATAQSRITVGSGGVKDVRIGMDGQLPPSTRVVVDLAGTGSDADRQHELTAGPNGSFVLTIHDAVVAHRQSVPAAKSAKAASQPALSSSAPVPAVASVSSSAQNTDKPSEFAFVEPKYSVKDDKRVAATTAPVVKAEEAASRFADKTAAELVATNNNAARAKADEKSGSDAKAIHPAVNLAAEQKTQLEQQPAATGPKYTGEPISVNLKDVDLKDFFRLIHEISGLNVVLDPTVHGNLTIVLDDVPWDQALDIVLKNNDLARELEGNVLRIATVDTLKHEADGRRAQVESEALAVDKVSVTRFLSYAKAKDVIITVKKFISQRGDVVADDRTNAVIINDIPKSIPAIDRLLTQLDRKTQEVEIEARVVAATRQFARDIGTQLGFGWGDGHSAAGGASSVGSSPTTVGGLTPGYITTPGTGGGTGNTIPLFSNLGVTSPSSGLMFLNASNTVRIDAVLTMAESRGLLKVLSRPRVVTQNNIQAFVKQGVRVPIVTQAQLGGPPTVTYVDAFLRLTVTPQITSENTIFLNVDVENTTPNFGQEVQGNPELITQQATTQVLVTDGGTVVIGGVIQTQNSINISQVPLLGNIPILGNLFRHTKVDTSNQDFIFFITPRIIQT